MRVAGRGDDGKAKAIKTSPDGTLTTNSRVERPLFGPLTLNAKSEIITPMRHSGGHENAKLMLHVKDGFDLFIRFVNLTNQGAEYVPGPDNDWKLLYSNPMEGIASNKRDHEINVKLTGPSYQYKIVSKSNFSYQLGSDNREILYHDLNLPDVIKTSANRVMDRFFKTTLGISGAGRQALWRPESSTAPGFMDSKGLAWANIRTEIKGDVTIWVRYNIPQQGMTPWAQIYSHKETNNNFITMSFKPEYHAFQLMVQNESTKPINIQDEPSGQGLVLTDIPLYEELGYKDKPIRPFSLGAVASLELKESDNIIRTKKNYGLFKIQSVSNFELFISYYNYNNNNILEAGKWERILTGYESDAGETINYEVGINFKTSYFKLAIKNTTKFNGRIKDNTLIFSDLPLVEKEQKTKRIPSQNLKFLPSPIDIVAGHKGYDDIFYTVDSNGVVRTYNDITTNSDVIETGANVTSVFDPKKISYMFKTPQGIVYFTNFAPTATVYFAPDIHTVPTEVWTCSRDNESFFQVNGNINGIDGILLASVYGFGNDAQRELLLSKDGGQTFEVIKKTVGFIENPKDDDQATANSHFHGNAIDVQSGFIYVLEGDRTDRSHIWCSRDLGNTWEELEGESGINMQPTLVIPFYDKVSFIRDGKYTGVDEADKPKSAKDKHSLVRQKIEFNDQYGWAFFGRSESHEGQEAYVTFQVQSGAERPILAATGDAGESWHQVFWGVNNVGHIFAMDDNYVYVYDSSERNHVLFSEKPKWVNE